MRAKSNTGMALLLILATGLGVGMARSQSMGRQVIQAGRIIPVTGPEIRTTPIPPRPGGVETATIVSVESRAMCWSDRSQVGSQPFERPY